MNTRTIVENMDMTRDEMISRLCIRDDGLWLSGRGIPKLFVTVGGPAEKYTDAELALLVPFTEERQAAYRARCGSAKLDWADNFISFDKDMESSGDRVRWGRKRYSWRQGRMHAASLPEAIATFWGDRYRGEQIGDFCLLDTGEIVEVVERLPYDREGDYACRRLVDGAEVLIRQHKVGGIAIHARSIEALGDAMRMAMEHRIANRATGDIGEAEDAAARAAMTGGNDPKALTEMWAARVLDWFERDRMPVTEAA
jgi:hypothetical protein